MWLNNIRAPQCKLIGYDSIDSTNNEAEKLISNHTSQKPLVVFANEQTDGKGRLGKKLDESCHWQYIFNRWCKT